MAAGSTYTPIATTTLGSAAASYTFSSIPSTYTDLALVCNMSGNADLNFLIQFNGDTASNYSYTALSGSGSAAYSARFTNQTSIGGNYQAYVTTSMAANSIVQIMNYSNTTTNKTTLHRFNNAGLGLDAIVGLWRSTAAINSITILNNNSTTYATGSTFTLYGIQAA